MGVIKGDTRSLDYGSNVGKRMVQKPKSKTNMLGF